MLSLYYTITLDMFPSKGRGCDRMAFGFTTTCAISAYHH